MTPPTLCKDVADNILVVEGKDDCMGIYQIAARHDLASLFGLWEGGNDSGALARFGGLLLSSSVRPVALGIVLDCDTDEDGGIRGSTHRWAQIQQRLESLPYKVPVKPDQRGTIIEGPPGFPKVGVWLMPDNQADGMFEDFLLHSVPPKACQLARRAALYARRMKLGTFKDTHTSKAVAHTFLAWQDEPGKPLGLAIKANMFSLDDPLAITFVEWLRRLYK